MLRPLSVVFMMMLFPVFAVAQTTNSAGHGYAFAAPGAISGNGGSTASIHYGVGGERFIYRGLAGGGEVGYFAPISSQDSGIGIFSANASYHFKDTAAGGRLVPFVTGGYTLFFRGDTANGFNVGGGATYWFKERFGLRFEVRDQVLPVNGTSHFIGVRIGLTFR